MQAIRTRYYGPTNTRGSRIVAKCEAGSVKISADGDFNGTSAHAAAAAALVRKLGWDKDGYAPMYGGNFEGDEYWVFAVEHAKLSTEEAQ